MSKSGGLNYVSWCAMKAQRKSKTHIQGQTKTVSLNVFAYFDTNQGPNVKGLQDAFGMQPAISEPLV